MESVYELSFLLLPVVLLDFPMVNCMFCCCCKSYNNNSSDEILNLLKGREGEQEREDNCRHKSCVYIYTSTLLAPRSLLRTKVVVRFYYTSLLSYSSMILAPCLLAIRDNSSSTIAHTCPLLISGYLLCKGNACESKDSNESDNFGLYQIDLSLFSFLAKLYATANLNHYHFLQ